MNVAKAIIKQLNIEEDSRLARNILIKANLIFVQFLIDTNQPKFEIDVWDRMQFFEKALDEYSNMFSIYNLDDSDCEKSFKSLDKNSDQHISLDEMIAGLDDFFYSKRVEASGNLIFGDWQKVSLAMRGLLVIPTLFRNKPYPHSGSSPQLKFPLHPFP